MVNTKEILHKVLDFEQIFNISEGSFGFEEMELNLTDLLKSVSETAKHDLEKRNITINEPHSMANTPENLRTNFRVLKQVIYNLITAVCHNASNTSLNLISAAESTPQGIDISIEISCANAVFTDQQASSIANLCQQEDLLKIVEQDNVEASLIVAFAIAFEANFLIEFEKPRGNKKASFTLIIPAEGSRTPTGKSIEDGRGKNTLRKMKADHAEVLLLGNLDSKEFLEQEAGYKCDHASYEDQIVAKLEERQNGSTPYKMIFVDLDDPAILLQRFNTALKSMNSIDASKIKVYAIASNSSERIQNQCSKLDIRYVQKPLTRSKM